MKKNNIRNFGYLFYKAGYNLVYDDGIENAGYLTFLGMLAFFPFMVFFVAFAGFLGRTEVVDAFLRLTLERLPQDVIEALVPRVEEIVSGPPQGMLTIAILGTIWTASSAVEGMRSILNRAYRVATPPHFVWRRLMSIFQFILFNIAIFTTMMFIILAPAIMAYIPKAAAFLNMPELLQLVESLFSPVFTYMRYLLSFAVLVVAIGVTYFILPNIKQKWPAVMPGAVIVAISWVLGGEILSVYIKHVSQFNVVYGSLAGVIIAMIFFFVMAVIYIYGAEFNHVYALHKGMELKVKEKVKNPERKKHKKKVGRK